MYLSVQFERRLRPRRIVPIASKEVSTEACKIISGRSNHIINDQKITFINCAFPAYQEHAACIYSAARAADNGNAISTRVPSLLRLLIVSDA